MTHRILTCLSILLLPLSVWAAESYGPYTIDPGDFTLPTIVVAPVNQDALVWFCPDLAQFSDEAQVLVTSFEECDLTDAAGKNCRLIGGTQEVTGGVKFDREGQPFRCYGQVQTPKIKGKPFRLRMVGTLTSEVPVDVTVEFSPRK